MTNIEGLEIRSVYLGFRPYVLVELVDGNGQISAGAGTRKEYIQMLKGAIRTVKAAK